MVSANAQVRARKQVDMNNKLRQFVQLDNPEGGPPVIPYPVYL